VGANECKCSRDQRLNVSSEEARDNTFLVTLPMTDQRFTLFKRIIDCAVGGKHDSTVNSTSDYTLWTLYRTYLDR
jgi:hypothetical protein